MIKAASVSAAPERRAQADRDGPGPMTFVLAASVGEVLLRVVTAVAVAIVTTIVALRLLGGRRGWVTALLAGAAGWALAALLTLGLNNWDWGADGLLIQMVAVGVVATMAAAVAIDLLSRPGSLARGERAGLVVAPRPIRAVRQRIAVLRRYRELVRLARRNGFGPLPSAGGRAERTAQGTGVRIRRVLEEAGGVYVKLGQIASTRPDLVPPEICAELAGLQNQVAPVPVERVREALEEEIGADVDTLFAEFDWEPLAAGSIGQTYRACLRTGEPVVVKIQRPGIENVMERDLAALALLAGVAQRRTPFGQGVRSAEMLAQFASSLRAELDFRREAEAMSEMTTLLGPGSAVRVPKVYGELCTRRLLVQERFEGFTLADTTALDASDIDRRALGEQLLRSALEQVLRMGFFHADPHPGNIFAFADGTLGLIDFGAVGRLDPAQRSAVIDMLSALARRDASLLRDGIERVADMSEAVPPERLERALARLMADHVRASGAVDPTVLQDLVRTLAEFDIRLPADLVVLSRALVTLDGTLRVLSPGLSLASAMELMSSAGAAPVLDPQAMVRDELLAALPHLRRLPERIDRILTLTSRGDLRLRHVVDEDSHRLLRTFVNRGLLAAVGAAFLFAATALLVAPDAGPTVASSTGLFELLGYGGLLAGTVLLLRVVAAVARDGTT
jgi:ubiquinone biosynthesis protein